MTPPNCSCTAAPRCSVTPAWAAGSITDWAANRPVCPATWSCSPTTGTALKAPAPHSGAVGSCPPAIAVSPSATQAILYCTCSHPPASAPPHNALVSMPSVISISSSNSRPATARLQPASAPTNSPSACRPPHPICSISPGNQPPRTPCTGSTTKPHVPSAPTACSLDAWLNAESALCISSTVRGTITATSPEDFAGTVK